jgi:hypothetical protein
MNPSEEHIPIREELSQVMSLIESKCKFLKITKGKIDSVE